MKKVLIFGISGFVGPYLAREFIDSGYIVYGTDLTESSTIHEKVIFKSCDIINEQEVAKTIAQIAPNIIINLAGVSSVGNSWNIPQTTMIVNVVGSLNILEAVRRHLFNTKIMFIGSSEEYESKLTPINEESKLNANNPYGISKVTQSSFISLYRDQYKMKIYEVRPFNHTGIGQSDSFVLPSFCKQVAKIENSKSNGTIKVGNLDIKRDFSHVKDIVRAYRMIIENEDCTTVYNIGSGNAYTLNQILNFIIGLSGKSIKIETDYERYRVTDTPIIQADCNLIKEKLGWEPRFTVWDALKEMYGYFLKEINS